MLASASNIDRIQSISDVVVRGKYFLTFRDIEIILVDDGSPDNCPQICDDYKFKKMTTYGKNIEDGEPFYI